MLNFLVRKEKGVSMNQLLAATALGSKHPSFIIELTNAATKCECSIIDSRMTTLGSEIATIMLISGTWNQIAKMETQLKSIEKKHDIKIHYKRSKQPEKVEPYLPYNVQIVTLDTPGIIHKICEFFTELNITITELTTNISPLIQSDAAISQLNMRITIPSNINISDLREQFLELCDELNLDAILEPEKAIQLS